MVAVLGWEWKAADLLTAKALLTAVVAAFVLRLLWSVRAKTIRGVVCPITEWPFVGSLFLLTPARLERFLEFLEGGFKTSGALAISTGLVGLPPVLWTTDPKHVEYILKTNFKNYEKGKLFHSVFEELLGNGIFNSDGHQWRVQRQTASHLFTMRKLKDSMAAVFVAHAKEVVHKLAALRPDEPIDMQSVFFAFTLDSICEIAFGVKLGALSGQDVPFMRAFDAAQCIAERRWYAPWWPVNRWLGAHLGLTTEAAFKRHVKLMDDFARDVIAARRKEMAERPDSVNKRNDLLSLFMLQRDENGQPFSDDYLRDVVMNFIIAGRDTTAQALSWMTHLIAKHPDVERNVFTEVDSYFASMMGGAQQSGGGGDAKADDEALDAALAQLSHVTMHYLMAATSESLRLYPSVPKDPKFAVADDTLPGGIPIPAGTIVVYCPYSQGRRTELWGPDALEYKPSRWLDSNNQFRKEESPFKFSAFQAGPRLCLGKHVAYLETKILICALARQFRFRLVPDHPVEPQQSVTLPMRYGLRMTVARRTEFFANSEAAAAFTAEPEQTLEV